MAVLYHF